jgi:hypothetical protein
MKKFLIFCATVIFPPLLILAIINILKISPEPYHPISDFPIAENKSQKENMIGSEKEIAKMYPPKKIQSDSYMKGYWDGKNGKALGPIQWILNDEYRQGHMVGAYDKKNKIERYENP